MAQVHENIIASSIVQTEVEGMLPHVVQHQFIKIKDRKNAHLTAEDTIKRNNKIHKGKVGLIRAYTGMLSYNFNRPTCTYFIKHESIRADQNLIMARCYDLKPALKNRGRSIFMYDFRSGIKQRNDIKKHEL